MSNTSKGRKCLCCGKTYEYCGKCQKDKHKPTYFALYCSDNCYSIFHTTTDYNFDLLTKEEAQKKLAACDLSELESFNDIVKADVKKIIAKPEPVKTEALKAESKKPE